MRILPCRFTVAFEEMDGSPTETITKKFFGGTEATRIVRCASRDRIQLIREFLGSRRGMTIYRPHEYPDISTLLVATSATTVPKGVISAGGDAKFANYSSTEIVIKYTIPDETFEAFGGLVTVHQTIQEASEFITCPVKNLFWYVDGIENEPIDEFDAPGKVNKLLEWTYEVRGALTLPPGIGGTKYYGKVNSIPVHSQALRTTWPVETLLCGTPTIAEERDYEGVTYNFTLRFLIKNNGTFDEPFGWNHYPRISVDDETEIQYERMVMAVDAPDSSAGWKLFYPLEDFDKLFVP